MPCLYVEPGFPGSFFVCHFVCHMCQKREKTGLYLSPFFRS